MRRVTTEEQALAGKALASLEGVRLAYDLGEACQAAGGNDCALDLGLLFVPTLPADRYDGIRLEAIERVAVSLGTPHVGAIILNGASPSLIYSAIYRGKLLFSASAEDAARFETTVRTEFLRTVYDASSAARHEHQA